MDVPPSRLVARRYLVDMACAAIPPVQLVVVSVVTRIGHGWLCYVGWCFAAAGWLCTLCACGCAASFGWIGVTEFGGSRFARWGIAAARSGGYGSSL
eukprot:5605321-Prymnesium_polylepis.1